MDKIILFFIVLLFASCRSIELIPVEHVSVRTEYRDRVVERRDSVLVQDSIYIVQRGDTIYHDRWHIRYRERVRADTIQIARRDSIVVPRVVEVERKASYVETLTYRLALLLIILGFIYCAWICIKKWLWRKLP